MAYPTYVTSCFSYNPSQCGMLLCYEHNINTISLSRYVSLFAVVLEIIYKCMLFYPVYWRWWQLGIMIGSAGPGKSEWHTLCYIFFMLLFNPVKYRKIVFLNVGQKRLKQISCNHTIIAFLDVYSNCLCFIYKINK